MIIRVKATTGRETGEKLNNSIDNRLAARWMAVDTRGLTSAATAQGGGETERCRQFTREDSSPDLGEI